MAINFQTSRLDYYRRHFRSTLPHLTLRKVANLALNFLELHLKTADPRSLPPYLKVEPTPHCHMRCTGCPHHEPLYKKQLPPSGRMMTLDEFKKIVDPLSPALLGISMSFRGEPLVNRALPSLVQYANSRNIATSFPTNLSIPLDTEFAAEIVESGLDAMYVSLDGVTEETYLRYRIGGDFNLVLNNVALLAGIKQRLKVKRPRLIWKFVIFDYNESEIPIVLARYKDYGFDEYEFVRDYGSETAKEEERKFNRELVAKKRACYFPWNTMTVTADGFVKPCCLRPEDFSLGSLNDGVKQVWHSEAYRQLRAGFGTEEYGNHMHKVCKSCVGLTPKLPLLYKPSPAPSIYSSIPAKILSQDQQSCVSSDSLPRVRQVR